MTRTTKDMEGAIWQVMCSGCQQIPCGCAVTGHTTTSTTGTSIMVPVPPQASGAEQQTQALLDQIQDHTYATQVVDMEAATKAVAHWAEPAHFLAVLRLLNQQAEEIARLRQQFLELERTARHQKR